MNELNEDNINKINKRLITINKVLTKFPKFKSIQHIFSPHFNINTLYSLLKKHKSKLKEAGLTDKDFKLIKDLKKGSSIENKEEIMNVVKSSNLKSKTKLIIAIIAIIIAIILILIVKNS